MNKDMKKKYDLIAKISGVVIGLVLVLGISYAVFRTTTMGDKDNVVSAGKLDVRVENEKDEITIPNALPQTEAQGKSNTPYTFDIVNEGTIDAMYDLYIELSDDTTLKDNDIRYYLTKTVDGTETPIDEATSHYLSDALDSEKKEKKLYRIDINDELKTKDKVSYKLYLWIDYDATADEATNKVFKANIRVDASQLVERNETLLRKVDVSENSDGSAYAYVYDDGTLKIKGTGNIASGIDDMDIYATNPTKLLNNYKKVLTSMGYDVSSITTMDELQTFVEEQSTSDSSFSENLETQAYITIYKETLEEMGYSDTDTIVDIDTAMTYFQNNGIMDSEGNLTEKGETVSTKAEEKYNDTYAGTVSITNVEISEGITNIPEGLYTGNKSITTVTIPSTVTSIDDYAFSMCTSLATVEVSDTATVKTTSMEYMADDNENNIAYIGSRAFQYCSSLTSVEFMENSKITTINNAVFFSCTSLTNLKIPSSVTSIGEGAFIGCSSLSSIEIPSSVISIGSSAFCDCTVITSIEIPSTVTSIGSSAFSGCRALTSITIPDNVTAIEESTFQNCTSLTTIEIPSSVTSIGSSAFIRCRALTSLDFMKNSKITAINDSTFYGCTGLTEITIPNSVTSIGSNAFYGCTGLTEITIPNSVETIGSSILSGCTNLTKLTVNGTKKYNNFGVYTITDLIITGTGNMYNYGSDGSRPWYSSRSRIKNITISDTLTSIGANAFWICTGITSIEIPSSIISIGGHAFSGCTGLTSITIPSSVTSIGISAFLGCSGITKLSIDGTKYYKNNLDLSNVTDLTITGIGNMYDYNFCETPWYSSDDKIKNVEISDTLTSIGTYAFYNCTSLTEITIPSNITTIGYGLFHGCTSLTTINVDENNENYTLIDGVLFTKDETVLVSYPAGKQDTTYSIPSTVTYIQASAFSGCSNLTEITIPNSVTVIGSYAFDGWTSSQTINIDNTAKFATNNFKTYWKSLCNATINYLRT